MEPDLTPKSLAGILDEGFDLYKQNFGLFAGIAVIMEVPRAVLLTWISVAAAQLPTGSTNEDLSHVIGFVMLALLGLLACGLLWIVHAGAQATAASSRYLSNPVRIGEAYKRSLSLAPRVLGAYLLICALMMGVVMALSFFFTMLLGILSVGAGGQLDEILAWIVTLSMGVVGGVLALGFIAKWGICIPQVITVESAGAGESLSRTGKLVEGHFRRAFWLFPTVFVMTLTIANSVGGSLALVLSGLVFPRLGLPPVVSQITEQALPQVAMAFMTPYTMAVFTVHYFDLRVRKEGFDLAVRANRLQSSPPAPTLEGLSLGQTTP